MFQAALRPYWDAAAETRAPAEQRRLRLEGTRRLLDWVTERSPFYRERFRKAGVDLRGIRTLEDFAAAVPLTAKQELRDAMERMGTALPHLCVPREQIVLAGPSAGTSGRQTYQAFTAEDLDVNTGITARLHWCCGLRPGDVFHLLITPFTPAAEIFKLAAQRMGVHWVIRDDHEPNHVPRYVDVAHSLQPTFLQAGVATLRAMVQHAAATFGNKRMAYRKAILMGAALGAEARAEFREESGIDVYTLSGQGSDFNLFGTQCDRHDGEHWHADDLTLVELIDPNTGMPAQEGELGELVITDFYRRATPHVRWRTEDMYRMHPGPCACGRTTRRYTLLDRLANRVTVGRVSVYPFQVEESLSRSDAGRNLEFSLVRRSAIMDILEIRLMPPVTLPESAAAAAARTLEHHLAKDLSVPVRVSFHDALPYVGYKTLRVVEERNVPAPAY